MGEIREERDDEAHHLGISASYPTAAGPALRST
jgi:hypothetical protein